MSSILTLLTNPTVRFSADDIDQLIPADKRGALLIYLAYSEDWVQREQVSFLFWPDKDDKTARRNLRQVINRCKKLSFAEGIELDDHHLRWTVSLDTIDFKKAIAEQNWQAAIELYQGNFCEAFTVKDANGFQDWVELEREGYASAFAGAVRQHTDSLLQQGNYKEAAELLKRVLQQDELAEDIVQRYLQAAYLAGQRDEALTYYRQFSEQLKTELELEPLEETQNIVKTIEQSQALSLQENKDKTVTNSQVVPLSVMRPPKLVGREENIETILTSDAKLITLVGEAGIGKTRLMAEIAPNALLIKAQEGLQNIPLNGIASFIKEQQEQPIEELGVYLDDLVRLIPELNPLQKPAPADPLTAKQRLLEAIALYFEALAPNDGFAIAFDDIQWFDDSSIELLIFLHNRGTLKLIASSRKHELSESLAKTINTLSSSHVIELEPLEKASIETLLTQLMNSESKPQLFANWLHKNTGGNIMFVLETLKSLFETGDLRADQDGWHSNLDEITQDYSELVIPKVVSELIQKRINNLSEEANRVLQVASAVGEDFDHKLLGSVSGLSQWAIIEAFEEVQGQGIVSEHYFTHDLLRQSIYKNISTARKQFLHEQIASYLEQGETPELTLAEHWLEAKQPEKALKYWLEAADELSKQGLVEAAQTLLENISKHINFERGLWELDIEKARNVYMLGDYQSSSEILAPVLKHCFDAPLRALALDGHTNTLIMLGQMQNAADAALEGFELAKSVNDEELLIKLRNAVAYSQHNIGNRELTHEMFTENLIAFRKDGPSVDLVITMSNVATSYAEMNQLEKALPLYLEALELSKELGSKPAQINCTVGLVFACLHLDKFEECIPEVEQAFALGYYRETDTLRINYASGLWNNLGKKEEAIEQFEILTKEAQSNSILSLAWSQKAALLHELGAKKVAVHSALDEAIKFTKLSEHISARAKLVLYVSLYGTYEQKHEVKEISELVRTDLLPDNIREQVVEARAAIKSIV